jgi:DNA primase
LPRFTDDSRERVRDAVDFVELVGARTELRRASPTNYTGRCPFHDERTPSFGINPQSKVYYCFGCGAGGDVFKFVMETENMSFPEALETLADRFNVQLETADEDPQAAQRRARRDRLLALLERTAAYYVRLLWEGDEAAPARSYLESRGLDEATLREFRVGYSPSGRGAVVAGSRRSGFTDAEIVASGLGQQAQGGGIVDRFFGRLMFPLADPQGRVLGFGARALRDGQQPKYLNSPEGETFSKGRMVFGAHLARASAAKAGFVVLVEGYTDVVALHQAGLRNVVASMGTALTENQAREFEKMAPRLLLCLDADAAGQRAMLKAAEAVGRGARNLDLRVVPLPAGADPAEIVQRDGAAAVQALLDRAVPFVRWQVERALSTGDVSSAEGRDRVLDEVRGVIRPLPPSVLREELVQLVAGRLALSDTLVAEALRQGPAPGPSAFAASGGPARAPAGGARGAFDRREAAEHAFLALCIALPDQGALQLAEPSTVDLLSSALARRAAAHLRDHLDAPATGLPPEDGELSHLIAELVIRAGALEDAEPAELDRAALMLSLARLDRDIATARVDQAPLSELAVERQRVLTELRKLTR